MFETRAITKRFGGVEALDGVDISVDEGEIVGLIGPNGAGKTTVFNCISGVLEPDEGEIVHRGTDVTGLAPEKISHHGIVRTFQVSRMLYTMTVMDNMLFTPHGQQGERLRNAILRPDSVDEQEARHREKAEAILEKMTLLDMQDHYARELSGGQQKLLEIGRSLMTDPDLILLDEPLAGVAPELVPEILDEIERIREEEGTAFLVIEHDLKAIKQVSDELVVLSNGQFLTRGDPETVSQDPEVRDLYIKGGARA